ncbi:Transcription elongation factor 1 [Madurella mycetomatis]|uniref:Transcription elongation factor 1 homolog n=1 Tax=Madurella mycetomatis TaxID=100816 RepID=A0A175WDZ4_9PEZI|nr:Transcription elongation factor 1 [Madurella mycetomatis]
MGKRKSSKKPVAKKKACAVSAGTYSFWSLFWNLWGLTHTFAVQNEPLPTVFTCLFCNHEKSIVVKLDKKAGVGHLECKVCGQNFQCGINYLSAAVDVYSEWVDAADAVAQESASQAAPSRLSSGRAGAASRRINEEEDEMGYEGEGIVADDDYE